MEHLANDPLKCQDVQDVLSKKSNMNTSLSKLFLESIWKNSFRFNGFLFGINLSSILSVAYNDPYELFDSKMKMVGQENWLSNNLEILNMTPVVSLFSFVYHYKSITVASAAVSNIGPLRNYQVGNSDNRENISLYHPELLTTENLNSRTLSFDSSRIFNKRIVVICHGQLKYCYHFPL